MMITCHDDDEVGVEEQKVSNVTLVCAKAEMEGAACKDLWLPHHHQLNWTQRAGLRQHQHPASDSFSLSLSSLGPGQLLAGRPRPSYHFYTAHIYMFFTCMLTT